MRNIHKTMSMLKVIEDVGGVKGLTELLTPREVNIVGLRFGLYGATPQTLAEIAVTYNLTSNRILQIEAKSFRKLQRYIKINVPKERVRE